MNHHGFMKLKSITIKNYRSIEKESMEMKEIDGGFTYTLIGINESGKSSILKAISLKEGSERIYIQDFHDTSKPIEITFEYLLNEDCPSVLKTKLKEAKFTDELQTKTKINQIVLKISFEPTTLTIKKSIELALEYPGFNSYTLINNIPTIKKEEDISQEAFNLKKYLEENFIDLFFDLAHNVVFWKSEPKYLITELINLDNFAKDPKAVSIPLKNCFELANIRNIPDQINKIKNNPSETANLMDKLGDAVTTHVRKIWPDHPIKIKFHIDGVLLTFLIEDEEVKYKVKTTNQRSDGFRQFVSFLLTISAQNSNSQLSNSLLLLDEPETHIHPKGQENLRDEIIKISKGNFNNIVIFATHSNYMIDKEHLERCLRVVKERNEITKIKHLDGPKSSYSEVNYIVFEVATNDYHNELYGYIEAEDKSKLDSLTKDRIWKNLKSNREEKVSLSTYIRHSIHHPENTVNLKFTQEELIESIKILIGLKSQIK